MSVAIRHEVRSATFAAAVAFAMSGCAGVSPTRIIGNTVGAAGGAFLGHTLERAIRCSRRSALAAALSLAKRSKPRACAQGSPWSQIASTTQQLQAATAEPNYAVAARCNDAAF